MTGSAVIKIWQLKRFLLPPFLPFPIPRMRPVATNNLLFSSNEIHVSVEIRVNVPVD